MEKSTDDIRLGSRKSSLTVSSPKKLLPPINTKLESQTGDRGRSPSATTSANHRRTESQLSTHSRIKLTTSAIEPALASGGNFPIDSHSSSFWVTLKSRYPNIHITIGSILSWYFFSMSISFYNKWMFSSDKLNFSFPIIITAFHQLILTILCILTLIIFPNFRLNKSTYQRLNSSDEQLNSIDDQVHDVESTNEKLTYSMPIVEYFKTIFPCSLATALDIGLGNTAFRFITLTLYTMGKTSSLIFVLFWGALLKLERLTSKICIIVSLMTGGVVLMIWGQQNVGMAPSPLSSSSSTTTTITPLEPVIPKVGQFSQYGNNNHLIEVVKRTWSNNNRELIIFGVMLVLGSACMSGLRWALTQLLLKKNKRTKNPILTMFYLSPGISIILFILGSIVEGINEFWEAPIWSIKGTFTTIILILIPGILAFSMTISEFVLLQHASLLTLSIAGIFKELLTIFLSWLIYRDVISWVNLIGLIVTVLDILWYNHYRFYEKENITKDEPFVDIELDNFPIL